LGEELRLRLFENRVLRIIFRPKMGRSRREMETTAYYRACDMYCSQNIIWGIKSRRMKLAEHVARMGRGEEHTGILWENLRERDHLEDPDVCGKTLLKCVFKYWNEGINLIDLPLNRDKLRALVKVVLNLRVP
jgi:hypothetical protein